VDIVYIIAVANVLIVGWLWWRLGKKWRCATRQSLVMRLVVLLFLTSYCGWFLHHANRYHKIRVLQERMSPIVEFAVRHALAQPGTSPEEKVEMERRIREGIRRVIEEQVDSE
jgi:alkylation response protein AidB-like acyl-CoA dehydrogenase